MIHIRFEADSAALEHQLEVDARRWHELGQLVMGVLGEALASRLQDNLRTEGARLADRGVTWPALRPATVKIRRYYGHGPGPRLLRGGDLVRSIRVLSRGESFVEAGSPLPYAGVVHRGGTVDDGRGRRQVQAFPWAMPSRQDLDDFEALILDALEGATGGAPA